MPPRETHLAAREQVCDVFVDFRNGRKGKMISSSVPLSAAYAQVQILRAEPNVSWAYASEPRDA